jgi:hypothetical protein
MQDFAYRDKVRSQRRVLYTSKVTYLGVARFSVSGLPEDHSRRLCEDFDRRVFVCSLRTFGLIEAT